MDAIQFRFGNFLMKLIDMISGVAFVLMTIMIDINVFSRFLLGKSFLFMEEIGYLCLVWAVFFGVCSLFRRMGLIAIDIVVDKMPKIPQRIVKSITFTLLFVTNIILVWYSWNFAIEAWVRRTPFLGIPYFYMYIPTTLAFAVIALYSAYFLTREIRGKPYAIVDEQEEEKQRGN
jgi:TRAP-type C4-dicarboxylate transport system permease small subunit